MMHCRESAWFFVVVVFTATIAAPTNTSSLQWWQLAQSPKFQQYNATLLSQEVNPLLPACYELKCSNCAEDYLCSLYFDIVSWAEEVHFNESVTKEVVASIPGQHLQEFCLQLEKEIATIPVAFGHQMSNMSRSIDSLRCLMVCGNLSNKLSRSECSLSLWLLKKIAEHEISQSKPITSQSPARVAAKEAAQVAESNPADDQLVAKKTAEEKNPNTPKESEVKSENVAAEDLSERGEAVPKEMIAPTSATSVKAQMDKKPVKPSSTVEQTNAAPKLVTKPAAKQENIAPLPPGADSNNNSNPSPPAPASSKPIPTVAVKVSTENSPDIAAGQDFNNYGDQADEFESNEDESSMMKADNSDLRQSPKIERIETSLHDDQDTVIVDRFKEEPSSNFFFYFLFGMFACIAIYVIYNNKSKILALLLEGRRAQNGRGGGGGGGSGRRKHTAAYRKLDSNLEEAIMSSAPSGRTSQIIY